MSDIDVELQRLFDLRLGGMRVPPRRARRRSWRTVAAAALATVALALGAVAADVDSTAAANGVDCANLMTKVQFWTSAKALRDGKGPGPEKIAAWIRENGCAGAVPKPVLVEDGKRPAK